MRKLLYPVSLTLIFILGFYFRFVNLTQLPIGFNWDEASVGYNAYSLLKTGTDEFGKSLPIFIESFGDYKTGLYSILLVPIIEILGLSIFSVRILNVFIGSSAILAAYFFGISFLKKRLPSLILATFVATSPLLIHFSRFTLEWYAALPLFLIGISLIIPNKRFNLTLPFGSFFLGFSLYWYHSLRLFLPLLLVCYSIIYRKTLLKNKKTVVISFFVGLIAVLPLVNSMKQSNILARPQAVAIFGSDEHQRIQTEGLYRFTVTNVPLKRLFTNKAVYYGNEVFYRYISHFSPDFIFYGKDATPRISIYPIGKLQIILLPFLLVGLVHIFRFHRKYSLLIAWLLLSPIPASLTNDSPHGLRSLFFVISLLIVTTIGVLAVKEFIESKKISLYTKRGFYLGIFLIFFLNFFWQMGQYFLFYPETTSIFWQADQEEMISKLEKYNDSFSKIVITKADGQPHIFYAFFSKYDPYLYKQEILGQKESFNTRISSLGKIKFGIDKLDYCQEDTLIITKEALNIPGLEPIDFTYLPDRFHEPKKSFLFYDTNDPLIQKQKICLNENT